MSEINRILIANRGEIACRVMRTARALGIETVAVYSDADRNALHVRQADQAVHIGPSTVSESYLVAERIIEAAQQSGSDAIHPGYGFLSENSKFAEACEAAGITFIGPSAHAIDLMGDKARAKDAMLAASVPCIPGYQGSDQETDALAEHAREIGTPLMIKAAAGGGGRGMRLVTKPEQFTKAIETARSEALNAFGNGELILEKAITRARHVEVQVFGDTHGNIVYLGERDCSVQRRHQKVIEEAPCPVVTPELRAAMGEAAVAAARAVDYVGAGTVEFLLAEDGEFYFLEMNTRLQVEHPVTELITGLDLVALQIAVASGKPLGFDQEDVTLNGHAIEIRLYAEDPQNDFLPSTGHIDVWHEPRGQGVRVDAGVETGDEVSPYYDPMLAKVIAFGQNREEARRKLVNALAGSLLVGPATNRDFLLDALGRTQFTSGEATTAFIEEEYGDEGFHLQPGKTELAQAALIQYLLRRGQALKASSGVNPELMEWSSNVRLASVSAYRHGEEVHTFVTEPGADSTYKVRCGEDTWAFRLITLHANSATLAAEERRQNLIFHDHADDLHITLANADMVFTVEDISAGELSADGAGSGNILSPMHGQLLEISVAVGDAVSEGQRLAVLEAMKMQHEILADIDGVVKEIHASAGTQVPMDALLIEIEPGS